uniref:Uncharacterized protein n=1 Tax=Brassica oleracea TaxID=3712 RepID=A0A3P6E8B0_BRAOL|nr:unnamed protein product [Brassica oleracea]
MDGDFLLFSYDGCRIFLVSIFRDELPVKPKAPLRLRKGNVLKLLVIQRCILMIPLTLSVDMP